MQPSQRSFNRPMQDAQSATVFGVAFGKHCFDASPTKFSLMRLGVIATVALNDRGTPAWSPRLAAHGRNRVDQQQQLRHGRVCAHRSRSPREAALRVGNYMVLAAAFSTRPGKKAKLFGR